MVFKFVQMKGHTFSKGRLNTSSSACTVYNYKLVQVCLLLGVVSQVSNMTHGPLVEISLVNQCPDVLWF